MFVQAMEVPHLDRVLARMALDWWPTEGAPRIGGIGGGVAL
jgi:hypothetical protein